MMNAREVMARAEAAFDGANWNALSFKETPSGETPEEMRLGYAERADAILAALEAAGLAIVPVGSLASEVDDCEIEDALKTEGIYVWGPDGERFERMFAVVMKSRAMIAAAKDQNDG